MLTPQQAASSQPQQAPVNTRNTDGSLRNPQAWLDACLNNPASMAQLPPDIRDAVSSGDIDSLQAVFRQDKRETDQRRMEAQLIRPGEDPMDLEVQVRLLVHAMSLFLSSEHLRAQQWLAGQDCRVYTAKEC